jgi:DegV family protein with EDD domain
MSRIAICTDSTALFANGAPALAGVTTVPISVALDGQAYESNDPDDFYARLAAGATATTSMPSPGEFLEAYQRVAVAGAEEVVSIHLDARVSATVASAELAAREAPVRVTVVDSETVSFGLGACVEAAAAALSSGASAEEVARLVHRLGRSSRSIFVASSASSGRVGGGGGWAVMSFEEGVVTIEAACESASEATEHLAARILSGSESGRVAVGHAAPVVEPWADALADLLASDPRMGRVQRYRLTAPVGAHTGPLCFGAFWWPATPRAV